MPQYDVKHLKTGETKQLNLTISPYEQWKEDNPEWDKAVSYTHLRAH